MAQTSIRIALAQINLCVGDLEGNQRRILEAYRRAQKLRPDAVVFPELSLTGYPPEDLLLKQGFLEANLAALKSLARRFTRAPAIVGFVDRSAGASHDAAALIHAGRVRGIYHKQCLPNYAVFDEKRYFVPGDKPLLFTLNGALGGIVICEDLWEQAPLAQLRRAGASFALCLSASPYHAGKRHERERLFARQARRHGLALAYCNLVGGQDELVFDGGSFALDKTGTVLAHAPLFEEHLLACDLPAAPARRSAKARRLRVPAADKPALEFLAAEKLSAEQEIYRALVLGVRDYVGKNGFNSVVLGLSGGIDSALTACIAVDALGPERVIAVIMPSRYSTRATQQDARVMARNLAIAAREIPIEPLFGAYRKVLNAVLSGVGEPPAAQRSLMEQNLQARIRGMLLMALSNAYGWLVLTTGNKSEIATGYTTLYGDMAGGFAVIKDVPKTLVYRLAEFRNGSEGRGPIPAGILKRAPSAELKRGQRDQDSLPPYPDLDRIVEAYVNADLTGPALQKALGLPPPLIRKVVRLIDRAEYKRRQGPPGIRISPKAFGKDRRMPITNHWRP